jgi:magnesium transporter
MTRISGEHPLHVKTQGLLRRLVRRDAAGALRKVFARSRPEDIAAAMEHLTWAEQRRLYRIIDDQDFAADVVSFLSDVSAREVTREMTEEQVVGIVERMDPENATDLVALLPDDLQTKVLKEMAEEGAEDVRQLLSWPADSAGGLMSPQVFRMPDSGTCGQAIALMQQEHEQLATVHYVYVLNGQEQLVGVTSLRSLLTSSPDTSLAHIMTREIITVGPLQDQEEVARFVARYDLLAVPVVDEARRLLGVVTVDDVVDVVHAELVEDMLLMAGVSGEPENRGSVFGQGWRRAGWLIATIVGGIVAAEVIVVFGETLESYAMLAGFIPVVMGMGGNVGIQSATVAVRGLATGDVHIRGAWTFVWREARIGLVLGVGFSVMLGLYGWARYPETPMIGASVGASTLIAIVLATVTGSLVPILFERLGADPAIATGPFVTTLVDLLGIVVYFNIARMLLGL